MLIFIFAFFALTLWIVVSKAFCQHQDRCTMNIFSLLENIFTYLLLNLSKVIREWRFWGTWDSFDSLLFFRGRIRFFFSFNPIQTWQPFCHLLLYFADSPENTHNAIWNWYEEFCDFIPSTHLKKEICPFASMNLHKNAKKVPF